MPPIGNAPRQDPWPWRLRVLLIFGFVIAAVVGWASVSYFHRDPATVESFMPADGWCDAPTQGLGVHCFGDFGFPRTLLGESDTWGIGHDGQAPNPYTALGMVPHLVTKVLADTDLGVRGSLLIYLLMLAAALLAPALWVIMGTARTWRTRDWLPLLLVGVASGPFLMTMDRGNSIGFAVPFLLLFCLFLRDEPEWVAPAAVIAAASMRPQFVLLVLGLVAVRRWRAALYAAIGTVVLNTLAFAVWPGGLVGNIRGWLSDLNVFQSTTDVASDNPINISAAHAVSSVGAWLSHGPGAIGSFGEGVQSFVHDHVAVPGLILIAVVAIVAVVFRGRIAPAVIIVSVLALPALAQGVAYGYGLIFALVLASLILGQARPAILRPGGHQSAALFAGNDESGGMVAWKWTTLCVLALSLVPFIISTDLASQSAVKEQLGLAWLIVVLFGLVVGVRYAKRGDLT